MTSTMTGYLEFLPNSHTEGKKYTRIFNVKHGIGECLNRKSLASFASFGGHEGIQRAVDLYNVPALLPQNRSDENIFGHGEAKQMIALSREKYLTPDGEIISMGLSMGGGATMLDSQSSYRGEYSCFIALCPPTWDGMGFQVNADDDTPLLILAGALDQADGATMIARQVETVATIRRRGRKSNFYFTVFPKDDHQIWPEVYGAVGVPFATPLNAALQWSGKDDLNNPVTVQCVNDPAEDIYSFALKQKRGAFLPLKRLSGVQPIPVPTPTPAPTPAPSTPVTIKEGGIMITGTNATQVAVASIDWSNGVKEIVSRFKWARPEIQVVNNIPLQCLRVMYVGATRSVLIGPLKK